MGKDIETNNLIEKAEIDKEEKEEYSSLRCQFGISKENTG